MANRALITVINGQDGSYLAELFFVKGYAVDCIKCRSASSFNTQSTDHCYQDSPHLNLGTGVDLTIREFAEAVAAATCFAGEIHWGACGTEAHPQEKAGFEPPEGPGLGRARIPLEKSLVSTVKDFGTRGNERL